ncbi:crotonase/enoyl-CoA hydratase family protein [Aquimarina agarivorans]|uniref:crotonase/enoyl-CoA hydratase family protein n=1 Tax=Aquimarina agarivorans TaxID=980584 RepID=UPI000248ED2B|nr:crotonase/enoyl-CoA hydratase family protein [Aquimarina agarivorans]
MRQFHCVNLEYFPKEQTLFWKIKNTGIPNFCLNGLKEFQEFCSWVKEYFSHPDRPLKFIVSGSEHQGIYNMGGDLPFFLENIQSGDIENLRQYAHLCVDAIYNIYTSFDLPVLTIALVEGKAYGGGFECALAHDYILAVDDAQFGLPENKFNLFPGMGAYSLLHRKLSTGDASEILKSGRILEVNYLKSLGLINTVFSKKEEEGELAAFNFVSRLNEHFNFEYHHALCTKKIFPLDKKELLEITNIWVEACFKIKKFDLRRMEILGNTQLRKSKAMTIH